MRSTPATTATHAGSPLPEGDTRVRVRATRKVTLRVDDLALAGRPSGHHTAVRHEGRGEGWYLNPARHILRGAAAVRVGYEWRYTVNSRVRFAVGVILLLTALFLWAEFLQDVMR